MSITVEKQATVREPLPGERILSRAFWLIVVAVASGFAYSTLLLGSHGGGRGGMDANGNYLDANGNPTTTPPVEMNAVLHANPAILVLLGVIVLGAIILVLRFARDEHTAVRIINLAMIVVAVVAVCCVVAGYVWFFATPLDHWTGNGLHYSGFPFASVNVTTQPMTTP
jgi:hypothetical protein